MQGTNTQNSGSQNRGRKSFFTSTSSFAVWTLLTLVLIGLASYASLSLLSAPHASAVTTVPTKMNFQGRLSDAAGNIKANGTYNMQVRLYTVSSGGTAVWTENRLVSNSTGVTVSNGLFSLQLGSVVAIPAALFMAGPLYLEVQLPTPASATSASPVWTEPAMSPRSEMVTSAYAYNAELLDGVDSDSLARVDMTNTFAQTQYFSDLRSSSELQSTSANGYRNAYGNYGMFLRNDGTSTSLMLTGSGDQYGSFNTLRPLQVSNSTGNVGVGDGTLYVQNAGNVGINNVSPTKKLDVDGTARITGPIQGGTTTVRTWTNVAVYNAGITASPGAFVIKTNVLMSANTMTRTVIDAYLYDATAPLHLELGGYFYSSGSFPNRGYTNVGSKSPTIRYAKETATGYVVIIIGDVADTYNYPKLAVTQFQAGHSALSDTLGENWTIAQATDLSAYDTLVTVPDTTAIEASSVTPGTFGAGNYTMTGTLSVEGTGVGSFSGTLNVTGSLLGNGKVAIETGDTWLRLNDTNAFSSGILAGTGVLRTDGNLQVGASGASLSVTSTSFAYQANTLYANSSGNVGIGTATPNATAKLTVLGSVNTTAASTSASVLFDNAATSTNNILGLSVAGTNRATIRAASSGAFVLSGTGSGTTYLNLDNGTGGVNVGTTANPNNLTVNGTSSTNYGASYQAAYYYCPNGSHTLSGTNCTYTATYNSGYYYCPSGGSVSGTNCNYAATYNAGFYYCPNGETLSGTTCSYSATYHPRVYYCPTGSLSGTTCSYSATITSGPCSDGNDNGNVVSGQCVHTRPSYQTKAGCESAGFSWTGSYCYSLHSFQYTYSCPNGGTLSGSTCSYSAYYYEAYYDCPNGGNLSGTTCSFPAYYWSPYYTCPNGGTLSGTTCTYAASYQSAYYTCPSGGSLSGTTCTYAASYQNAYYYCPSGGVLSGTSCYTYTNQIIMKNTSSANIFAIDNGGNVKAKGTVTGGVASPDYAENIGVSDLSIGAADVVAMDPNRTEWAIKANKPYDSRTLGVISTNPGFLTNASSADVASNPDQRPLALSGRVPVKVSTIGGDIKRGDYLTSSTIPGYAMKATGYGAVIGVAMEDFEESSAHACETYLCGKVLLFINPSLTNPATQYLSYQGGMMTLDTLNVAGMSSFSDLAVSGNVGFGASVRVAGLTAVTDLLVRQHIETTGNMPTVSTTNKLGTGAVASVTGNDTAGNLTFTVGTGNTVSATSPQVLTVTFAKPFSKTPYIMLRSSNQAAIKAKLYTSARTNQGFTISALGPIVPGETYTVTYWAVE